MDPDVERLLRDAVKERAIWFKEVLNEAARAGLRGENHRRASKLVQRSFPTAEAQEFGWDRQSVKDPETKLKAVRRGAEDSFPNGRPRPDAQ